MHTHYMVAWVSCTCGESAATSLRYFNFSQMDCDYVPQKKSKRQLKKDRKLRKERKGLTEEEFLKTLNEEKSTIGPTLYHG